MNTPTVQFNYTDYSHDELVSLIHEAQNMMAVIIPVEGSNSGEPINIVSQAKGLVHDYKYIDACGRHWFTVMTGDDVEMIRSKIT